MKVGDLVKHTFGVMHGEGLVLRIIDSIGGLQFELLWNCHGHQTFQQVGVKHFEVISESR
jgi:hypothetical protein